MTTFGTPAPGALVQTQGAGAHARVMLRPIGTPLPLGFLALGIATFAFGAVQVGWIAKDQGHTVALAAIALTVPLQLIASVFGFLARDAVAGTGMGILAGTWGVVGLATLGSAPGSFSSGLGVVLIASAAALLVPAASAGGKIIAASVIALSAIRFAVTGIAQLAASQTWLHIAGWVGLLLALLAWYAALAFELESTHGHAVIPLIRRGQGARVADAGFAEQVADVHHEPGVRQQL